MTSMEGRSEARAPELRAILAASDLSDGADRAISAAAALGASSGAAVHGFHCVPSPAFPYWDGPVDGTMREQWVSSGRTDLEWQVRRVLGDEHALESIEVEMGEPAREIEQRARKVAADLIVLGAHRPRGPLGDLLGTTADRVIRTTSLPTLILNGAFTGTPERILFPIDFSPPSRHAVRLGGRWIGQMAARRGDGTRISIEVLYVSAFAASSVRPIAAIEPRLAELTAELRDALPAESGVRVMPRILSAPVPVDGILRAAEQWDVELICVGTHGYSTLGRALLGSVATEVARTAARPILLVPPP